jgi:AbrB family looped-hinge helix DNA binding protein
MGEVSVTVSSKGQIAIPKAVREEMGLTEGTKLSLSVQGRTLVLRRRGLVDWRTWRGKFKGVPLDRDLAEDHRREIERDRRRVRGA